MTSQASGYTKGERRMLISTKGRYTLFVLIDLAKHMGDGYVPLKEITDRQGISKKYMENILKVLVDNNLLEGIKGKGGGYRLAMPPEQYSLGTILRLTEGSLAPTVCAAPDHTGCDRMKCCPTRPVWLKLNVLINNYLDGVTLADLLKH